MNRRAFLAALSTGLAATAALAVVDPERLLWTPGAKTFFLPSERHRDPVITNVSGLTRGDVFTIDGVYAINPLTNRVPPVLQQFVVTADVQGDVMATAAAWPASLEQWWEVRKLPREMRANPLYTGLTL